MSSRFLNKLNAEQIQEQICVTIHISATSLCIKTGIRKYIDRLSVGFMDNKHVLCNIIWYYFISTLDILDLILLIKGTEIAPHNL